MINIEKKYIGVEFMDMQYNKHTVEDWSDKYNTYLVREEGMMYQDLMGESQIEFFLNKQDKIKECQAKTEEQERKLLQQKQDEEYKYNFCHGFCDNLTAMQKGKVLAALNKTYQYDTNNYGVMSRKDFIFQALKDGSKPSIRYNVHYYSSRTETGYAVKPTVYCMDWEDGSYSEITKTEYEYALFLIDNNHV